MSSMIENITLHHEIYNHKTYLRDFFQVFMKISTYENNLPYGALYGSIKLIASWVLEFYLSINFSLSQHTLQFQELQGAPAIMQ